ncbi:cob(I)yrinic acid a,c-diamide adenosyltransferase [Candidatus Omnitrophota bacterium]
MIQVYTGKGKGKTTAAFGLALRAAGAGKRVFIAQFVKSGCYSEIKALSKIKKIKFGQFGSGCFIRKKPNVKEIQLAQNGLLQVRKLIRGRTCDLLILDEVNIAMKLGILKSSEVLQVIKAAPKSVEVVLTGRYAPASIKKAAHLVSDIREIKHYYRRGVKARKGIEF